MNYCPECGGKLRTGTKFCAKCGTRIQNVSNRNNLKFQEIPIQKTRKTGISAVIIIFFILCVMVVGITFFVKFRKDPIIGAWNLEYIVEPDEANEQKTMAEDLDWTEESKRTIVGENNILLLGGGEVYGYWRKDKNQKGYSLVDNNWEGANVTIYIENRKLVVINEYDDGDYEKFVFQKSRKLTQKDIIDLDDIAEWIELDKQCEKDLLDMYAHLNVFYDKLEDFYGNRDPNLGDDMTAVWNDISLLGCQGKLTADLFEGYSYGITFESHDSERIKEKMGDYRNSIDVMITDNLACQEATELYEDELGFDSIWIVDNLIFRFSINNIDGEYVLLMNMKFESFG